MTEHEDDYEIGPGNAGLCPNWIDEKDSRCRTPLVDTGEEHRNYPGSRIWRCPSCSYDIIRIKEETVDEEDKIHRRTNDERRSLDDEGLEAWIARVKAEILTDMGTAVSSNSLVMPLDVGVPEAAKARGHDTGGYSELHDYVDANCYGGACDDETTITLGDVIAMQEVVNEWLILGYAYEEKLTQINAALALMGSTFTLDDVSTAINRASDDINDAADLPDSGVIDALNLLVNATLAYLTGDASDLETVAEKNYEADLSSILGWIGEA